MNFLILILMALTAQAQQLKSIIGSDDRQQVTDLRSDPVYSSIGIIHKTGTTRFCTGTLITQRHVLTNGHCVITRMSFPATLMHPREMTFTPGKLSATSAPFGVFKVVRVKTFALWTSFGRPDFDVAVLELDRPTNLPAIKLLSFPEPSVLRGQMIYVTGYSGQKSFGTQWEGVGLFAELLRGGQSFTHSADTLPGTSGSLVRLKHRGEWVGIGVHRGSYFGGRSEMNRGVLLNSSVITAIKRWIKK